MSDTTQAAGASAGFRRFRVIGKTPESRTITSFHLEPVDPGAWRPFEPGQFLAFKIPVSDERGHVIRTYSVSSPPSTTGTYRITVKRETAPHSEVPHGLGSVHLHDTIAVGDTIIAEGPRGDFMLDSTSQRPVVLLSGGVGLTPLVSMLHTLASESDRKVYFIHACDSGDVHALGDEVRAAAVSRRGIVTQIVYRFPTTRDLADKRHDRDGIVTRGLLQDVLPLDDYDVYMCGPPPFMKALYPVLRSLGVPKHRIAFEFFGPATVLEADAEAPVETIAAQPEPAAGSGPGVAASGMVVTFRKSGKQAAWNEH
ncbi:MAG TPA: FAD-binding oxidoreductase, partial [Lichenihabitans sp.]|nr:FAD-binding oxidoreductase [Lichenihabitans sp.]